MNWDWEKLQEKRQRQGKTPQQSGGGPENPFKGFKPGGLLPRFTGNGLPVGPIVIVLLVLWLASGIFIVNPGEVGVVTRFGAFHREVTEGFHIRLPYPLERSTTLHTELLRTVELGQSSSSQQGYAGRKAEESSMFTGDENIVHMQFNVQYQINVGGARDFLFQVKNPEQVVALAAEAAMREVVGRSTIDSILTAGRKEIEAEAKTELVKILNHYNIGVDVKVVQLLDVQPPSEVEAAFKDVASAREDRERIVNQAQAYWMEIVPVANGTAQGMINSARAYQQVVEARAQGESERFLSMVAQFEKAKDVTKKRMYLEAMEEILASPDMEKVIMSKHVKGSMLPLLNLNQGGRVLSQPATQGGAR